MPTELNNITGRYIEELKALEDINDDTVFDPVEYFDWFNIQVGTKLQNKLNGRTLTVLGIRPWGDDAKWVDYKYDDEPEGRGHASFKVKPEENDYPNSMYKVLN